MRLTSLRFRRYRSLREEDITFDSLNVLIGPNASGKSTIIDALRLLNEAVRDKDFAEAVYARGGVVHLAWKGEYASNILLSARFEHDGHRFEWSLSLEKQGHGFSTHERVAEILADAPPQKTELLVSNAGTGWWWSGQTRVQLDQAATGCALSAAAADASFPARHIADFVRGWGFFDPSPVFLRRATSGRDVSRLEAYGANLAGRLFAIREASPETFQEIVEATRSVLGVPEALDFRESEDGRVYFMQREPGLQFPVHQVGASSGTLRMLALMTAIFEGTANTLVGIEEPENHVHPAAIAAFAEHLKKAREHVQLVVTTHSPLLLDALGDPAAVCLIRRGDAGTEVECEAHPEAVKKALEESGFGLGEFHQTRGFGA